MVTLEERIPSRLAVFPRTGAFETRARSRRSSAWRRDVRRRPNCGSASTCRGLRGGSLSPAVVSALLLREPPGREPAGSHPDVPERPSNAAWRVVVGACGRTRMAVRTWFDTPFVASLDAAYRRPISLKLQQRVSARITWSEDLDSHQGPGLLQPLGQGRRSGWVARGEEHDGGRAACRGRPEDLPGMDEADVQRPGPTRSRCGARGASLRG